ncbi:amidohydrolase family protein [Yinghuangia seranimata]|uniref:amidohydrolase family protein n=1 Tax=Yinghuangia seranimata TaxID=408067 RepID=UPI00248AEBE4|nr:amidohydrolase family protein [Yinghuangia seranimata]MDI2129477.1 amidohydrolase family protein [Yinghuangia seranimata]
MQVSVLAEPAGGPGVVIDAHHHVWELAGGRHDWITGSALTPLRRDFTLDDLRPAARAAGVDGTVVVQTVTVADETRELLALAEKDDLVRGVVGWTDLTAPDIADALAELRSGPGGGFLVGIRHQVQHESDDGWLLRPEVRRGLTAVGEAGLAYDLLVQEHQLPAAFAAAELHPEVTFVLDHLGNPPIASGTSSSWAGHLRELARLPNTVCKLSGMVTAAHWDDWTVAGLKPYVDTALDAFGPNRLMTGSDWPICTLAADYATVTETHRELLNGLGPDDRAAVLGGTAAAVYRM